MRAETRGTLKEPFVGITFVQRRADVLREILEVRMAIVPGGDLFFDDLVIEKDRQDAL